MNTPPFVQKHSGTFVSAVLAVAAVVGSYGVMRYQVQEHDQRLQRTEVDAAASRETRWIVDQHTHDIMDMKLELRRQSETVADIRTDVKLIAAWVKQQQDREARASLK